MRLKLFLSCWLILFQASNYATIVNGRILTSAVGDSIVEALIQLNTNTGTDDLGGATIVIRFDTTIFNYRSMTDSNSSFSFHNFSGGNYSNAFITRPFQNELWINVELVVSNQGNIVAGADSWTDLVTIKFISLLPNSWGGISFATSSPYWAIFDGDNYTLWELGNFEIVSGINDFHLAAFDYSLEQNYPNPFNPNTKIRFKLAAEENVKLNVYNVAGELVQELINNKIAAGSYEVKFDGTTLPSGVYIYRIESNNFISSKKMLLIK